MKHFFLKMATARSFQQITGIETFEKRRQQTFNVVVDNDIGDGDGDNEVKNGAYKKHENDT